LRFFWFGEIVIWLSMIILSTQKFFDYFKHKSIETRIKVTVNQKSGITTLSKLFLNLFKIIPIQPFNFVDLLCGDAKIIIYHKLS